MWILHVLFDPNYPYQASYTQQPRGTYFVKS